MSHTPENRAHALRGKTVFITGGTRGIGKAIALRCARDGANVVIAAKTVANDGKLKGTIFEAAEEIDRLDDEASKWYEKYARATQCPPGRSRRGPYVRPGERQRR